MGEAGLPGGPAGRLRQPSRPRGWSGQRDSNPRHQAWEACTLPAELCPLNAQQVFLINSCRNVKAFPASGLNCRSEPPAEAPARSQSPCGGGHGARNRLFATCLSGQSPPSGKYSGRSLMGFRPPHKPCKSGSGWWHSLSRLCKTTCILGTGWKACATCSKVLQDRHS